MIARPRRRPARPGFTLVEMLVTVAVVSLMMVMFARVFTLAGGSVATQKGIARNDQRARVVLNLLRSDLDDRTFKTLVPIARGEALGSQTGSLGTVNRRGYFYLSENDPADGTDDVLQFVIQVPQSEPVSGKATRLTVNPDDDNEPDFDDGEEGNAAGSSQYAVVSYFLRYGVLYRRILLIREPPEGFEHEPGPMVPPAGSFWNRFDYDAHNDGSGVVWHGYKPDDDWLDNDRVTAVSIPFYRFGHDDGTGFAREYAGGEFIGRFTHEETSHTAFRWPIAAPNPANPALGLTVTDGVVTDYANGSRRGEDILMQNCHEFDVKVFDSGVAPNGAFVDIGSSSAVDFAAANNRNPAYRSNGSNGRNVFDTWHPQVELLGGIGTNHPPYRPAAGDGPDGMPGTADDVAPKPLIAIQVRVRFFDPDSGQLRQMTMRHSLTPPSR